MSPANSLSQGHTQSRATSWASAPKFMQELFSWTKPRSATTDGHKSVGTYPCISSLFSNISSSFFWARTSTLHKHPPPQALCEDWPILQSAWYIEMMKCYGMLPRHLLVTSVIWHTGEWGSELQKQFSQNFRGVFLKDTDFFEEQDYHCNS